MGCDCNSKNANRRNLDQSPVVLPMFRKAASVMHLSKCVPTKKNCKWYSKLAKPVDTVQIDTETLKGRESVLFCKVSTSFASSESGCNKMMGGDYWQNINLVIFTVHQQPQNACYCSWHAWPWNDQDWASWRNIKYPTLTWNLSLALSTLENAQDQPIWRNIKYPTPKKKPSVALSTLKNAQDQAIW